MGKDGETDIAFSPVTGLRPRPSSPDGPTRLRALQTARRPRNDDTLITRSRQSKPLARPRRVEETC